MGKQSCLHVGSPSCLLGHLFFCDCSPCCCWQPLLTQIQHLLLSHKLNDEDLLKNLQGFTARLIPLRHQLTECSSTLTAIFRLLSSYQIRHPNEPPFMVCLNLSILFPYGTPTKTNCSTRSDFRVRELQERIFLMQLIILHQALQFHFYKVIKKTLLVMQRALIAHGMNYTKNFVK